MNFCQVIYHYFLTVFNKTNKLGHQLLLPIYILKIVLDPSIPHWYIWQIFPCQARRRVQGSCISLRIVCTSSPLYNMMNKVRVRDGLTRLFIADWSTAHHMWAGFSGMLWEERIGPTFYAHIYLPCMEKAGKRDERQRRRLCIETLWYQKVHTNVSQEKREML